MLGWLVKRHIDPHISVWDQSKPADGTVSRSAFASHKVRDIYICPGAKVLKTTGRLHSGNSYRSVASTSLHCRRRKQYVTAFMIKALSYLNLHLFK